MLQSGDAENRTEHTRWTKSGVSELCSDNDAEVSEDPLDEQLPRMLLLILSTTTHQTHCTTLTPIFHVKLGYLHAPPL